MRRGEWRRWLRQDYVVLAAILVLAAVVRFYKLDTLPLGLYHDEAYNGLDALALTEGKTFPIFHEGWELYAQDAHAERTAVARRFPIFFEGNYGREPVHVYLMALSVWMLGARPLAVRVVPAVAGVLAVWTVYLVAGVFAASRQPLSADEEYANGQQQTASGQLGIQKHRGMEGRLHLPFAICHLQFAIQRLVPLFAAFTMAILYPAVHFSRFGLRTMVYVPVEVWCVYFFLVGIEDLMQRREDAEAQSFIFRTPYFILSGFLLGLGLYIYTAGRLMPFVFVLFVPLWFWVDRGALKRFGWSVGMMAAVALVTVVPMLVYFWRYPYFLFFRSAYVAANGDGIVEGGPWLTRWLNVGRVIRGLFVEGEEHFRHNLPGRPFMDAVQSGFFVVGLMGVLRNIFGWEAFFQRKDAKRQRTQRGREEEAIRQGPGTSGQRLADTEGQRHGGGQERRASERQSDVAGRFYQLPTTTHYPLQRLKGVFLLLWFVVMLLPSILSSDAPHFGRLTGVMPVVAVIVGLGAGQVVRWGAADCQLTIVNRQLTISLVVGLMGVSTVWMARDYFVSYARHPLMQEDFYIGDWEAGLAMGALPQETALYLTPGQQELATFYFALAGERGRLRNFDGNQTLVPAGVPGSPAAYFVRQDDGVSLEKLRTFFLDGEIQEPLRRFTPFVVENPAAVVGEPLVEGVDFGDVIGLYSWKIMPHEGAIDVWLVWRVEGVIGRDYTAFVHVLDGSGELVAQVDRPPAGYPTSDWRPRELIVDVFTVPLPEGVSVEGEQFDIRTGFYYLPTLEPLAEPVVLGGGDD